MNSSAIRLWQLKKTEEFYSSKYMNNTFNNELQSFYGFMCDSIEMEINDLETEIKNIRDVEKAKKPKNPFGDY